MSPPLRSLGHRAPLLWLALPLMAGIAWGRLFSWPSAGMALGLAFVAAASGLAVSLAGVRGWAACTLVAMMGAGVGSFRLHDVHNVEWDGLPPREAELAVRLDRAFPRSDAMVTGVGTIVGGDGAAADVVQQRVYVALRLRPGQSRPVRSAIIRSRGVLTPVPPDPPAASFDRYLIDEGIHVRLARGHIVQIATAPLRYYVTLEHAAEQIGQWLDAGVAAKRPAEAAIFRAMMLGQKHELSGDQNQLFMHSGSMHLFAINGLHIGVVAMALHALLALCRCPRRATVPLILAVLWFDVDTTGATPSAVRAFLLVACVEAGLLLRRPPNALASLSAATVLALLCDPFALFSASFQMSYGVVLAIVTFGLPIAEALERRFTPFQLLPRVTWAWWQRLIVAVLRKCWGPIGIGTAAAVISALTGPTFFQIFAPVGIISNLFLVPLAALVIVAGFASVVSAALFLGGINLMMNHAAIVALLAIEFAVQRSARLPSAWWPASWRHEWLGPAALAAVLAAMLFGYSTGWRRDRGGWWPPIFLAAMAVAFGVRFG